MRYVTQEEGIDLFNDAGYIAKISESGKTFSLWEGDVKLRGYSNIEWLTQVAFILKEIKSISFSKGYSKGRSNMIHSIKELLEIS